MSETHACEANCLGLSVAKLIKYNILRENRYQMMQMLSDALYSNETDKIIDMEANVEKAIEALTTFEKEYGVADYKNLKNIKVAASMGTKEEFTAIQIFTNLMEMLNIRKKVIHRKSTGEYETFTTPEEIYNSIKQMCKETGLWAINHETGLWEKDMEFDKFHENWLIESFKTKTPKKKLLKRVACKKGKYLKGDV